MNKKFIFSTLVAALVVVPVLAAPGSDADARRALTRAEAQAHAAERFARMDANKDGKLDAADRTVRHADRQAKRFAALDADGNGSISKAEWNKHGADRAAKRSEYGDGDHRGMRGHRGKRGGHHGMMLGKADADGDKSISQAEYQIAALARFDAADANKDGQVTPEERQAQRGAWRASRGAAPATPASE